MDTIEISAAILMIIASAAVFAWILAANQVAVLLSDALLGFSTNTDHILLIMMGITLAIGLFMETIAAITILVPVLMPIALTVGIDPVHFGILLILNLMLGLLTPPVGMVLFVLSQVSGVSFERCVKGTAPFLVPLIIVLLLILFFPADSALASDGSVSLMDKVWVITAAAQGIGRATAERLVGRGARVVATDINLDGLESLEGVERRVLDVTDGRAINHFGGRDRRD